METAKYLFAPNNVIICKNQSKNTGEGILMSVYIM